MAPNIVGECVQFSLFIACQITTKVGPSYFRWLSLKIRFKSLYNISMHKIIEKTYLISRTSSSCRLSRGNKKRSDLKILLIGMWGFSRDLFSVCHRYCHFLYLHHKTILVYGCDWCLSHDWGWFITKDGWEACERIVSAVNDTDIITLQRTCYCV